MKIAFALACVLILTNPCSTRLRAADVDSMTKQPFGHARDGTAVDIYTLRNAAGCEARITNYGGIVVSLKVPDRQGKFEDVVMGFDNLDGYLTAPYAKSNPYFGALVGRYGNRIAHGRFELDGKEYHVGINNGDNSLHGGKVGFNQRIWTARSIPGEAGAALELRYVSAGWGGGFPRHLDDRCGLYAHRKKRVEVAIHRHHRQTDGRQSDEPLVLQPEGGWQTGRSWTTC